MNCYIDSDYFADLIDNLYECHVYQQYPLLPKDLKDEQKELIYALLRGNDVLGILSTGYGKSIIQWTPSICVASLKNRISITIIISPLNALMVDMVRRMTEAGLYGLHCKSYDDLENATFPQTGAVFFFMAPEVISTDKIVAWIKTTTIDFIIVDEGHVIPEWSSEFRKSYGRLYEIRSVLQCPLGIFTATVTHETLKEIKEKSAIREDKLVTVSQLPHRNNIFIDLRPPAKSETSLLFVVDELRQMKNETSKTIIFARTARMCTSIFTFFLQQLGDLSFTYDKDGEKTGYLFEMFSASTHEATKTKIMRDFCQTTSSTRVVIATLSFALGLDFQAIRNVIVFGLGGLTMPMLWQSIGRCGRNGEKSNALIFPVWSPGPRITIPNNVCVREFILGHFVGGKKRGMQSQQKCCSFCSENKSRSLEGIKKSSLSRSLATIRRVTQKKSLQAARALRNAGLNIIRAKYATARK